MHHSTSSPDSSQFGIPQGKHLHQISRTFAGTSRSRRRNGMSPLPRLYAIADASFGDPVQLAEALFDGGARLVQVRNKLASSLELLDQVERILKRAPSDARVIVNDRVDVARIAGAAGVHLGQDDISVASARNILGKEAIVGFSTLSCAQAILAEDMPVDYISVGPIFATNSKENPDP